MDHRFNPCQSCGGTPELYQNSESDQYYVECQCGTDTCDHPEEEEAVKEWNSINNIPTGGRG